MSPPPKHKVAFLVRASRRATAQLPINASIIPLMILLETYLAELEGRELTIKQLFSELPYSEMGVRVHFRRLSREYWIHLIPSVRDRRCKLIKPSEQAKKELLKFIQSL